MSRSICPFCDRIVDPQVLAQANQLRPPIVQRMQAQRAGWSSAQGVCPACALRFAEALAAERSITTLQATQNPPLTFPYYHPEEERVLPLPERLPDYFTFGGAGVTIAFLDSGYYPHPDLLTSPYLPSTLPPHHADSTAWRAWLSQQPTRIIHYVDLSNRGERVGLAQPSLWDDALDSWHGQMTTVLAAGNGALSGGHFRGFAPQANLLPIKIGRKGGRIPEEDILGGLRWLLRSENGVENWQRYGVQVLNISVGGDLPAAWQSNPLCKAAEELAARGVLIVAAAGNRGREELLPPANAPSVLTVGGIDDQNRRGVLTPHPGQRQDGGQRQRLDKAVEQAQLAMLPLYPHNYATVTANQTTWCKPELLAPARWLPSPFLPVSPIFAEMQRLGRLQQQLTRRQAHTPDDRQPQWLRCGWFELGKRMNEHKWVDPFYQHVDGTSVAAPLVAGVAAQMFAANPALSAFQVRQLLLASALPLPAHPLAQRGHGVLQPAAAVAAALRVPGGILQNYPLSATRLTERELQKWLKLGTVSAADLKDYRAGKAGRSIYLGFYAPNAQHVSVIGSFNHWQPSQTPLRSLGDGWWQAIVQLPMGSHPYRFWVDTALQREWVPDPENSRRVESGYEVGHSVVEVAYGRGF